MTGAVLIQNPGDSPFFPESLAKTGVSVRCKGGRIIEIGQHLQPLKHERLIDARGGALLPGLQDHHIHLLATAAARSSLDCAATDQTDFARRLRSHANACRSPAGEPAWVRVVNYHESIAGALDRRVLDRWLPDQPLRIQHSTGSLWILNSVAIEKLDLNELRDDRLERDSNNRLTGRLFRADDLLRRQLSKPQPAQQSSADSSPDLTQLSRDLASYGITSVTDTSATNTRAEFNLLRDKQRRGELLQRVRLMGGADLPATSDGYIQTGELKILLDEASLPDIDDLIDTVSRAHDQSRGVAFHCVTQIELAVVISVLGSTGVCNDRIEHASVVPANTIEQLAALGVRVVTQPGLIHARGDRYLRELDPSEHAELYRLGSLQKQGIPVAGSSDAPYGPLNPWLSMQCAIDRNTLHGEVIGSNEAVSANEAIALYYPESLSPSSAEGAHKQLTVGQRADLCVLEQPWSQVSVHPRDAAVTYTLRDGELIYVRA